MEKKADEKPAAPLLSTYERLRDTERALKQEDKESTGHLRGSSTAFWFGDELQVAALAFLNRKR